MAITAVQVNARIEAYDDAMAAGDFALARVELLRAKGLIVGLPDVVGQDGAQIKYGREAIDNLLAELKDLETETAIETTGKAPIKLFHTRPGRPGSAGNVEGIV